MISNFKPQTQIPALNIHGRSDSGPASAPVSASASTRLQAGNGRGRKWSSVSSLFRVDGEEDEGEEEQIEDRKGNVYNIPRYRS